MGEEKVLYARNWKIYLKLLSKYKWFIVLLLISSLTISASWIAERMLLKYIVDTAAQDVGKDILLNALKTIAIIFIGILLVRPVFRWTMEHTINKIDSGLIQDVKSLFFGHLIKLSHKFHTNHKTGSLISRLSRGSSAVERMTDFLAYNTLSLFFELALVSASLIILDITSGIIILLTVVVFIAFGMTIHTIQNKAHISANDAEDLEKGKIADIFTNVESVKNFGKETYTRNMFEQIIDNTKKLQVKDWNYNRWSSAGQALIIAIGMFCLIYFSTLKYIHGELSIGTIIFIYTSFATLASALWGFVYGLKDYYRVMADMQPLFDYLEIEQEVKDKPEAKPIQIKKGSVQFENITFKYGQRKIFEDFSLSIPAGKNVALVGHSGSGKSTLIKLLYRLYDVDRGSIKIDEADIRDVQQESLRSEMSIVPQECILFDDTIYNNILFSKPEATREEVLNAIKFAQLDKIIEEFPQKENTIVGERGVKLSGGEKQRVSIARAILADKRILVLDEATSALDSQTEHDIKQALEKLMKGRTTIIIAHRLSTIMKADKIVVLHKGKIVQMGKHKDLIRKEGEYKKLWNLQKGGYIK